MAATRGCYFLPSRLCWHTWQMMSTMAPNLRLIDCTRLRGELKRVWRVFDSAKAFGTRVDARVLFRDPYLRENPVYSRCAEPYIDRGVAQQCFRSDAIIFLLKRTPCPRVAGDLTPMPLGLLPSIRTPFASAPP